MVFFKAARKFMLLLVAVGLAACATVDPNADFSETDHYEGTARQIHEFNLAVDSAVLRPLAQGYDFATPALFKHLIGNGFSHLSLPRDFANHLLQGEVKPALETLGRFTINTVIGAGGFLDPATEFGLPKKETDFGITLAKHGVGEGTYFIVPFFGPTTTRDATGRIVDLAFAPTTYVGYFEPGLSPEVPAAALALETIDFRARNMQAIDEILYESEDSYVSLRAVYLQRRRAQAAGENTEADALPDIFDSN
jgi:phospholipid-binding lipoprotein MlaA